VPIGYTVSEIWAIFGFFKMLAIHHLICFTRVWTTHEEHLVVFVTVQNLVGIGVVVSIIFKI